MLLEGGANVTVSDRHGATALHLAVRSGAPAHLIIALIGRGGACALDKRDARGVTPLCAAVKSANVDVTDVLLDEGASYVRTLLCEVPLGKST